MDVTPLVRQGSQIIQGYADGTFRVSGQMYEGPVIVTEVATLPWQAPENLTDLTPAHFDAIPNDIEIVLLGCGKAQIFLPPALKTALRGRGLSVDPMDTGAACRTYNVLMAEGRRVAAALIPVRDRP